MFQINKITMKFSLKNGIIISNLSLCAILAFIAFRYKNSQAKESYISELSIKSNQEMKWWDSQGIYVSLIDKTSNVFMEDLLLETSFNHIITVNKVNQNASIEIIRRSGIKMTIDLVNIKLHYKYQDVEHPESDNDFILHAKSPSVAADLQKPLLNIIQNFCREPLPDHYFLTVMPFKNRYTRGNKIICNQIQMTTGSVRCPEHYYNGQIYAYRTVNDQCTHNKATYLPQDTDKFYCTQNSPILNSIFHEKITEKIELQSFGECQLHRKNCEKCFRPRCASHFKSIDSNDYENCCQFIAQCLLQPSCIDYYSPTCYYVDLAEHQHNLCIKGSTYQFTLNPQFSFNNKSFMCHMSLEKDKIIYQVKIKVSIPHWMKLEFHLSENVTRPNLKGKLTTTPVYTYESTLMKMQHRFRINEYFQDAILHFKSNKFHLYKLKERFSETKPIIKKHHQIKYTKIQASYPFAVNSRNWHKRSCYTNIEDLYENQLLYNESENISIKLLKLEKNNFQAFNYYVNNIDQSNDINIAFPEKSSILKSAICSLHHLNSRSNLSELKINFALKSQFNWTWFLEIKGEVESSYEYLNVKLLEKSKSKIVFNKDILIVELPVSEKNVFSVNHNLQFFPDSIDYFSKLELILILSDCHQSISYRMYIEQKFNQTFTSFSKNNTKFERLYETMFTNRYLFSILRMLFLLFIMISIIILVIVSMKVLLHINKFYNKGCLRVKCQSWSWIVRSDKKRKFIIIVYVTLRIMYTFIFTSTCIISIILTININSITQSKSISLISLPMSTKDNLLKIEIEKNHEKCDLITKLQLKKFLNDLIENRNDTIQSWYQSNVSIPKTSAELFQMNLTKINSKIYKYIQKKIMKNLKLRLADQIGPMKEIVDETVKLKWLSIISSGTKDKENFNFNILPIFGVSQMQSIILSKLNGTTKGLSKSNIFQRIFKNQINLIKINLVRGRFKRYFNLNEREKQILSKAHRVNRNANNLKFIVGNEMFSIIKIRISLLVLDLMLILFRCYNIYRDFQIIWFGSERLLPYSYFHQITELQSNSELDQFLMERKNINTRLDSNDSKKSFVISSLDRLKFFKNNYYITLVIFCGLSFVTIFIFVILQSSQLTIWIRSLFNLQIKQFPNDNVYRLQKKIFSLFSVYSKRRKHQLEVEFKLSLNNQKIQFKSYKHYQKYQQNYQSHEFCTILRIFSNSKNNGILKMKMQSEFLFIPLQIVEECLKNENVSNNVNRFQQQHCYVTNSSVRIHPDSLTSGRRQNKIELFIILQIRDFLLIFTSAFLISLLSMNLLQLIFNSKNHLLEKRISGVKILHFQSFLSNEPPTPPCNITSSSYPILRSSNSDDNDLYFNIDSRSPMKYLLIRLNDNRETDI